MSDPTRAIIRNSKPLQIGIIGCGRVATSFHLPALRRLPEAAVAAIAEIDPPRLDAVGDQFQIARRFTDYRDLIALPDLDVVAICTPTPLHIPMALAALEAGKHVLVEKPLALDPAEAERLIQAASNSDRRITVGFSLRHHRLLAHARAAVAINLLGPIEAIHTHWTIPVQFRGGLPEWRKRRATGGGSLIDFAVHHIDLWRWLLDTEVESVYVAGRSALSEDQSVTVTARLANGTLANSTISEASTDSHEVHLFGHFGALHVSSYRFDGLSFEPIFSPASAARYWFRQVETLMRELPYGFSGRGEGGEYGRAFENEWAHFLGCIRDDKSPMVSLRDGLQATRVLVAAAQSAETGQAVTVNPTITRTLPVSIDPRSDLTPELSVIVVTRDTFDSLRLLFAHLAAQTAAARLEIIVVANSASWLRLDEALLAPFARYQIVEVGKLDSLAEYHAAGVHGATAPLVVFSEDHGLPAPGWAEHLIRAHRQPCAAVSPAIRNANSTSAMSWADGLLCYGAWLEPQQARAARYLGWHHTSYKREVLLGCGAELATILENANILHDQLHERGELLLVEPGAVLSHVNISKLSAWLPSMFYLGRLYAGYRSRRWSLPHRLLYLVGTPAIPVVRLWRSLRDMRRVRPDTYKIHSRVFALQIVGWMLIGLTVSALGEFSGYAFGVGNSRSCLLNYEFHRWRQTRPSDWTAFMESRSKSS